MPIRRATGIVWSTDTNLNTLMSKCPIIGASPISNVSISADSPGAVTDLDFPSDNLLNQATHLRWRSQDTGVDMYLTVTGLTTDSNYVGLAGHNLSGFTLTVFGIGADSPGGSVTVFPATVIDQNKPLIIEYQRGAYPTIQLKISGGPNSDTTYIREIAVMHVGLLIRMGRGVKVDVDHAPITRTVKTDTFTGFSESGQFVGRLLRNQIWESKYEFSNIKDENGFNGGSELVGQLGTFIDTYSPSYPFFIAWAPNDYANDVGFLWLMDQLTPTQNTVTRRWQMTINARGLSGIGN